MSSTHRRGFQETGIEDHRDDTSYCVLATITIHIRVRSRTVSPGYLGWATRSLDNVVS